MKKYRFVRRSQWQTFVGEVGRVLTESELADLIAAGTLTEDVVKYLLTVKALIEIEG